MSVIGQLFRLGLVEDGGRSVSIQRRFNLRTEDVTGNASATVAISVVIPISILTTVSSDDGFTLADGKKEGDIKIILFETDAADAVITPANLAGGTAITLDSVGDTVMLVWIASNWHIISHYSGAVA